MKLRAFGLLLATSSILFADDTGRIAMGLDVMVGGRYDDLRMCVASPAGVKGGPIADVQLTTRYWINDNTAVGLKFPVMRPILFGLAFKMLQFEPEFTFQYRSTPEKDRTFVIEPSLGLSLHYGPDYNTPKDAESPDRFFAAGPLVAALVGVGWKSDANLNRVVGIKPFYIPLFSKERETGTVLGATVEGHWDFWAGK